MNRENLLTEERRARMAAERLLKQKEAELFEANRKLSRHAISLSEDLVETRARVEVVQGENSRVRADLERATTENDIAKRRLWNSIQSLQNGFAVFDADSRLVIANSAYLQPFDGLECIRPGAHYEEVVEAALAEGVVDIEGKTPAQWREEMLARWYSNSPPSRVIRFWDGTWIRLTDQRAPGGDTVSLGQNITASMRREAALKQARKNAEAANRAKSAFLANMSHEIRTPMNGVVGMADLLADSGLDAEQSLYVETIRSSGQALLTIINDVLDYSKIEAEKLVLHCETFDLERTILDVIQLLAPALREKGLKVMLDYDMFMPRKFEGDPVRIRQVLTNLIGNAVKFTRKGHVLVRVVGLPNGPGRQRIHMTVEDSGIGIAPEKLNHIFGEFNQVEDQRNRSFEGTGLGLAISRQLVELMGGQIWVESEMDIGSVFGIQLDLPIVEEARLTRPPGWIARVLLVMDDDLHRTTLRKHLIALGLDVTCAPNAAAALDEQADVIFADQHLSDMGAAALIAVLRSNGVSAPIVLVAWSADGRAPDIAGAANALMRPTSRQDLVTLLTDLEPPTAQGLAPAPAPAPTPRGSDETGEDMPLIFETQRLQAPADPRADVAPVFGSTRSGDVETTPEQSPVPPWEEENLFAPVVEVPRQREPAQDTYDSTPETASEPRPMRVLVAEDNKTNQLVFSKLVKDCNIDLTFVVNGHEAVAAFRAQVPDMIFMDISMPGMDGKEATRKIREIEAEQGLPRTRIAALTAHATTGDGEECIRHGLDAHLTKPLRKPLILEEIVAACPEDARPPLPEED